MSKSKSKKKRKTQEPSEKGRIRYSRKKLEKRTALLNEILRYWFHTLTATERLAVLFIFDRTWLWGKEWERITYNQFTQGIFDYSKKEKQCVTWAAPFTRDRGIAQKTINGLVEKGAIFQKEIRTNKGKQFEYSLNVDWEYPDIKIPEKIAKRINAKRELEES